MWHIASAGTACLVAVLAEKTSPGEGTGGLHDSVF